MRKLKRILALLTVLAMILTATAVSEEQIAPAEPEQPAAEVVEEEAAPAEPEVEEPAEDEPAEEEAAPVEPASDDVAGEEAAPEPAAEEEPAEGSIEEFEFEKFDAKCDHIWEYDEEDGYSYCDECGAVCKHKKGTEKYYEPQDREDIRPTSSGELGHLAYYDLVEVKTCKVCYAIVSEKVMQSRVASLDEHEYSGSVCDICGYNRNNCTHENMQHFTDYEYDEVEIKFVNNKKHRVTGTITFYDYCEGCGKTFNKHTEYTSIEETHEPEGGICYDCEHKIKCSHKHVEYGGGFYVNTGNSKYHNFRVIEGWKKCLDCGAYFQVMDKTIQQKHVYPAGSKVCALCGYDGFKYVSKISLSKSKLTLTEGKTVKLKATIAPKDASNKALVWTTSDDSVADVWEGEITAWEAGTAVITCSATDGSGMRASCTVKVEPVKPKSVKIVADTKKVAYGREIELYAELKPAIAETEFTWKSSKSSIADVDWEDDCCIVHGNKPGKVTISVVTANKKSAKCTVQVIPRADGPDTLTSAQLDRLKKQLEVPSKVMVTSYNCNRSQSDYWAGGGVWIFPVDLYSGEQPIGKTLAYEKKGKINIGRSNTLYYDYLELGFIDESKLVKK